MSVMSYGCQEIPVETKFHNLYYAYLAVINGIEEVCLVYFSIMA